MSQRSSNGSVTNDIELEQTNQSERINNQILDKQNQLIQVDKQSNMIENSHEITNNNNNIQSEKHSNENSINYETG
jgi:hypothetical protein